MYVLVDDRVVWIVKWSMMLMVARVVLVVWWWDCMLDGTAGLKSTCFLYMLEFFQVM